MSIVADRSMREMDPAQFCAAVAAEYFTFEDWHQIGPSWRYLTVPLVDPRNNRLIGFATPEIKHPSDHGTSSMLGYTHDYDKLSVEPVEITPRGWTEYKARPGVWRDVWPDAYAPSDLMHAHAEAGQLPYCEACGAIDPDTHVVDFGIGGYEYTGAPGTDVRLCRVTRCCDADVVGGDD